MTIDFSAWTKATGDLLPGQQRVFLDVLNLVSEGKAHLVYGADYRDGKPCLVNAVGQMLSVGGGAGVPSRNFGDVVGQFDTLNAAMLDRGINTDGYVSPLAADFLIRNFGEVKPMTMNAVVTKDEVATPYVEPSDEAMARALAEMAAPAPEALADDPSPEADYVRTFVNRENG